MNDEDKKEYQQRLDAFDEFQKKRNNNNNNNNNINNNNNMIIDEHIIIDEDVMIDEVYIDESDRTTYSIERARSNRSQCRHCWRYITYNALRFGAHIAPEPGNWEIHWTRHEWHHPECFGIKFAHDPRARNIATIDNNAGISNYQLQILLSTIFDNNDNVNIIDNNNNNVNIDDDDDDDDDDDVEVRIFYIDGINFRERRHSVS